MTGDYNWPPLWPPHYFYPGPCWPTPYYTVPYVVPYPLYPPFPGITIPLVSPAWATNEPVSACETESIPEEAK